MGIYVDYTLRAECSDDELRERLETVRRRCLDLPLRAVGDVLRVEPVFNNMTIMLCESEGLTLPEAIAERLRAADVDRDHRLRALSFAPMLNPELPEEELNRYYAPALAFMKRTDLWKREELPEKLAQTTPFGFSPYTVYRGGIEFEFASIMLRYGFSLFIHPGEGSESVNLALSTFKQPEEGNGNRKPPLWWGQGFTKTQYAKEFIQVHETVCRVLDIVGEEGLLLSASDNCGYYASRSWKDASQRVNEELSFAQAMSGVFDLAIGNMREEGVPVQVVQDNASKARPVDFSEALAREEAAEASEAHPPGQPPD
jgi:hypothetical protein